MPKKKREKEPLFFNQLMNTEFCFLTSVFSWTLEVFSYGKSELFDDKTKNGFKIQDLSAFNTFLK